MGASQSSQSAMATHEQLLDKLAGPQAINYDEAFWHQLFNLQMPLASESPVQVEEALTPHCRQLMIHNPITHNFQRLVLHTLDLVSAAQGGKPSLAVANALHMVSVFIKYMIETGSPSTLSMAFEATPGLPPSVQGQCVWPSGSGLHGHACMHDVAAAPQHVKLLCVCVCDFGRRRSCQHTSCVCLP